MTEQWSEKYMKALEKKMGTYTKENILEQDSNSKFWYLRSVFSIYSDESAYFVMQALVFELKENMPQVELIATITNDAEENIEELQKAIEELNYISPVGTFGLRKKQNSVYLRNCWPLDNKKSMEEMVQDTEIYYEMMLEGIQGVYLGLSKIWTGEMNYEEVVENGMLNRANG